MNALKHNQLVPGQQVSMDYFKVTGKGHLYNSMGKTHEGNMYLGGCIFVDHATGYIHIEHLINFNTNETILAKHCFENHMLDMGIAIQAYKSDNVSSPLAGSVTKSTKHNDPCCSSLA